VLLFIEIVGYPGVNEPTRQVKDNLGVFIVQQVLRGKLYPDGIAQKGL
jgi:hypothetical protein